MERAVAALGGGQIVLLDHIGIIAQVMQVPLLVTDPVLFQAATHYYPKLETFLLEEEEYFSLLKRRGCFPGPRSNFQIETQQISWSTALTAIQIKGIFSGQPIRFAGGIWP